MNVDNTSPIYTMHKYWGKKPSEELRKIIQNYSSEGDTVFDPFAGFGGIAVESLFQNRNVIINDLNPVAVFIAQNVLSKDVDIQQYKKLLSEIVALYQEAEKKWYYYRGEKIVTILRDHHDFPLKLKVLRGTKQVEISLSEEDGKRFLEQENEVQIHTWYPRNPLIVNSRISAKQGMTVDNLFPKRALICQSYLYSLLENLPPSSEKDLLLLSFTANLSNCSKLVPPIVSRGDMAQGAWMTGFYIGKTYLENNVFHYFENRAKKSLKGKERYLSLREKYRVHSSYSILNEDAKKLSLSNASVDLVFTDFPYGDTVPYFEQSQLWNAWLMKSVDYENEIIISDSNERNKKMDCFVADISAAIAEISRVLKNDKYFVFTFHSLSGAEWAAIINALNQYSFQFVDCDIILQKTLPPRQLNRNNTIKGDIVAVYKKSTASLTQTDFNTIFHQIIDDAIKNQDLFETSELIVYCIKAMLITGCSDSIDFKALLLKRFVIDESVNQWRVR